MSYVLKITLLLLRIASAIVEGILSTLQKIGDIIESIPAEDGFSTALTKNEGSLQSNLQTKRCSDLTDTKPYIIISNLSPSQKIIITKGNTDSHIDPLSIESEELNVQLSSNKPESYGSSKLSSETSPNSRSCATAVDSDALQNKITKFDSQIQKEEFGKLMTSKGILRNNRPNTNDPMHFGRKTKERSKSFSFGSNTETGGFREIIAAANLSNGPNEKSGTSRPKLSPVIGSKINLNGKFGNSRGKNVGIKRSHPNPYQNDNSTTYPASEEIKTVVPRIPLTKQSSNLEETILESNCSSNNLGRISSLQFSSLTKIPFLEIDPVIDGEPNVHINCLLCSAKIRRDVTCKNEFNVFLSPNSELEDSIPGIDNCIKISHNTIQDSPTVSRELDGTSEHPIKNWTSMQKDEYQSCVNSLSSPTDVTHQSETSVQRLQLHGIVDNLIRRRYEKEHGNHQKDTDRTSVSSTECNGDEIKCKMARTSNEVQTNKGNKIKVIEVDETPELETSNSCEIQKLEELPTNANENGKQLESLRNTTDETEIFSGQDLLTDEADSNETNSKEIDIDTELK